MVLLGRRCYDFVADVSLLAEEAFVHHEVPASDTVL